MSVTRRQLLKLSGLGLGAVLYSACRLPSTELRVQSPRDLPEDLVTGLDTWYATLCPQCSSSEGLIVRVLEGRAKKIQGNPCYPMNQGKHSVRCEAALQALYHPDRLSGPVRRPGKSGPEQPISWSESLDEVVAALRQHQGNPSSVLLVTGPLRGHMATLVRRFVSAYGAQHAILEPLEEAVFRQAVKRVFGQDRLPEFDIKNTSYLLSFGADFLSTWLAPVHYARQYGAFRQGEGRRRGTFVQVEPRMSMTAANADEWIPIRPGTEGTLALGIAYVIINEGLGDAAAARAMTGGAGAAALEAFRPEQVAKITGVPAERIAQVARDFATHRPSLALGGGSAGAHTNGLFNLTAIYALNFLVGSVNRPGGVLFNPDPPLTDLSGSPRETTPAEWRRLTERMSRGEITLVMVHGANPVYSLPGELGFEAALKKAPLVVNFSTFGIDDTGLASDLVLPMHAGLEDWGDDVPEPGPGYQVVGLQQPVVREFFESERLTADRGTRGFGDVLLAVAEGLGERLTRSLPWKNYREVLIEGARGLYGLNRGVVKAPSFETFWVELLANGGWWDPVARGAASVPPSPRLPRGDKAPQFQGDGLPFHLIPFASNALGDGRGAHLPWLQAAADPLTTAVWSTWIEVNTHTARELDLAEGEVVTVTSANGRQVEALVYPHPAIPKDVVAMPLGQGHRGSGRYAQGRGANVFDLLASAVEEETGALAWAATKVRIDKTGRQTRIPKFEGSAEAIGLEEAPVVQVTRPE
ncbi:MAG: molybdopterin-dependent oxidoreductase [Chloroflexi bacterium]|nr:molybdopterin-dependent oxidoreductase [Chloroflexota bacterium]